MLRLELQCIKRTTKEESIMETSEKKKSRKYTDEFKAQALQLAEDLGSLTKAAKQLGVAHANLHNWKLQKEAGTSASANASSVEEENKRLRKKVAELEKVNHILKAASAIFTRDHLS